MKQETSFRRVALLMIIAAIVNSTAFAQSGQKWGTGGNSVGAGDFLGTTNNFQLIFKTNNITRMQLMPTGLLDLSGNIQVGGTSTFGGNMTVGGNASIAGTLNVTGALSTNGNITANCVSTACLNVAGNVTIDNITTNRLKSPTGEIHFGDSSISLNYSTNRITWSTSTFLGTTYAGLSIGQPGQTKALGNGSFAIGNSVQTSSSASRAVVIGSSATSLNPLINSIPNSLMVGFNSNLPTLFVGPANGAGTKGRVGVGTTTPQRELHVMGAGRFENANGYVDVEFNSVHGIVNSSEDLLINYYSQKKTIIGPGMLTASGDFTSEKNTYLAVSSGNVGVGTTTTSAKLTVNGDFAVVDNNGLAQFKVYGSGNQKGYVRARDVVVDANQIPDYVFEKNYDMRTIQEFEEYIKINKHLPGIPSAKEIEKNGMSISQMQSKLLEKIEELSLYVIQLNKEVNELQIANKALNTSNK